MEKKKSSRRTKPMTGLRIAFVTDIFLHAVGGVPIILLDWAKQLALLGHHVYIVAPSGKANIEAPHPNVRPVYCTSLPAFFNRDVGLTAPIDPALFSFMRKTPVDIVHVHTPGFLGFQAVLTAKLLRIPTVGTFHTFIAHPAYLKRIGVNNRIVQRLAWTVSNSLYNNCDFVSCPSEETREDLLVHNCKKPIKIVPYGVDHSAFDNAKAPAVRAKYGNGDRLLLFVGRIAHEKNVPFLLDCFALIQKRTKNVKLVIVGDGPQMPEVKAKVRELGIQDKVVLTGMVKHAKLVKSGIFGACDIFVNASTTETGPLTMLEAQANGLVCVSVKGKGMALVKDGVNGYLVEPNNKQAFANAVTKLLKDSRTYKRMKKETLEKVKMYDLTGIMEEWEQIYSLLIKQKQSSKSSGAAIGNRQLDFLKSYLHSLYRRYGLNVRQVGSRRLLPR